MFCRTTATLRRRKWYVRRPRRGAVIVFAAFLMVALMAMLAFSIDVGYITTLQSQLDRAVDAGALAGAGALINGTDAALDAVHEYVGANSVGNASLPPRQVALDTGHWNSDRREFEPSTDQPSAIRVRGVVPDKDFLFAKVLGHETFDLQSEAVARYQPRDVMVVLDLSASMNDDSEFRKIPVLGREAIEANLLQIYRELGSPTYGYLGFTPDYATVVGQQPEDSPYKGHIRVQYRYRSVMVTSTQPLYRVRLYFNGGGSQNFYNKPDGSVIAGTGYYANRSIRHVHVYSGYNSSNQSSSNRYGESFNFDSSVITSVLKTALGLDGVPYPYPSGSWNSWIDYCRSYKEYNHTEGGYRYRFGYMNWVNYLLEDKPQYSQTPDLWKVSAQPITAVKEGVDVFIDFMQRVDINDRVGLVVYTSSNETAKRETTLTYDLETIAEITWARQAGHYHRLTNIGDGLKMARQELENEARRGAFKMIVLLTDGLANLPYHESFAANYVRNQATLCRDEKYPVFTISLGTGADQDLMEDIADMTNGRHFNIPGGRPVAQYEADLIEAFRRIASERPLELVQ